SRSAFPVLLAQASRPWLAVAATAALTPAVAGRDATTVAPTTTRQSTIFRSNAGVALMRLLKDNRCLFPHALQFAHRDRCDCAYARPARHSVGQTIHTDATSASPTVI